MSRGMAPGDVLPKELIEVQLGQVDLLVAMYAAEEEAASIEESSRTIVGQLRDWCSSDSEAPPQMSAGSIGILLKIGLASAQGAQPGVEPLELEISIPLLSEEGNSEAPLEPPEAIVRVRQPAWMNKADFAQLTAEMSDGDLFATIDNAREVASRHLSRLQERATDTPRPGIQARKEPIVRVWFYFPSISTRAKRDDLVKHAPGYGLTGFLLAGKPGLLCVEGASQQVDDYMKFIKTESWGDIPAHHKKVSERYREAGRHVERAFVDMREITDEVGERRGERANRQDMKALEAWLNGIGLGGAFSKVFI
ncbi:hypothetical protein GQ53DRAFT_429448 [Thozetella sp. PMI_491]|nr:hypothetical protein GQ53DRAFT_429448 [Thozetella sp. PMI_491]